MMSEAEVIKAYKDAAAAVACIGDVIDTQRQEITTLREALAPFARFAKMWNAKPMRGMGDDIYAIHTGTEWAAELKHSDLQRALTVLEASP